MNQKLRQAVIFTYAVSCISLVATLGFPAMPHPLSLPLPQPISQPTTAIPANAPSSNEASHPKPTPRPTPTPTPSVNSNESLPNPPSHPNYRYTALLDNTNPLYATEPFLNRLSAPAGLTTVSSANTNAPIVAVIDTGFALNHDDLKYRWALNPSEMGPTLAGSSQACAAQGLTLDKSCNNYDNDGDGYSSNWRGWNFVNNNNNPMAGTTNSTAAAVTHGTLTASLAAVLNPNAKILPLQALDDTGVGYTDTVAAAVRYAADHGANVISLSLGSPYDDTYLRAQIDYAIAKGIVVVAAAGNNGCDCLSYPAAYPEVLSVGASDSNDTRASFSSYGSNLDVVAPGTAGDVCGAIWSASNTTSAYSCSYSGTSFATPLAASLALLIQTQDPSASPNDVIRFMTQNADKVSAMGTQDRSLEYGYGRINVYKSVLAASLAAPQGQLLNKANVSLSSTDLAVGPLLDSTCQGPPGATCNIRITSADGTVVKYLGAQTLDDNGGTNFIWNAAAIGLTPGQWKIESVMNGLGQTTLKPAVYLTVKP